MSNTPSENVGTRLLFENDRVRVWDLALAPGEALNTHIHRRDYCFIVVEGGACVMPTRTTPRTRTRSVTWTIRWCS